MSNKLTNVVTPGIRETWQDKQDIILTIGVFFDGTGSNSSRDTYDTVNSTDEYDVTRKLISEQDSLQDNGFYSRGTVDNINAHTNIYKLYRLYCQNIAPDSGFCQYGLYIEGVGTEDGIDNNMYGIVTGRGSTGVVKKTDKAILALGSGIREYLSRINESYNYNITKIQFDIFGFSRGAAAARHFANRIFCKDKAIIMALDTVLEGQVSRNSLALKTRFLGLFDTVTALGIPLGGLNSSNADASEINIKILPEVAQKVFHITAQHECRFNFALNSVSPVWPELALPGVHSDIGGGYHPYEYEYFFITRPAYETVPLSIPDAETKIYHNTCEQLRAMATCPAIAPLLHTAGITVETWHDARLPNDRYGAQQKRSGAAAIIERPTCNEWSKVALLVMVDAAQEAGVKFYSLDDNVPGGSLQSELTNLCDKAILMGRAIRSGRQVDGFTEEEINQLANKFIHCSANWNRVEKDAQGRLSGVVKPAKWINFVNRPDELWHRTVYDMDGKRIWE